jgi:hypothetical protein
VSLEATYCEAKDKARERDALPMISIVRKGGAPVRPIVRGEEKEMGRDLWRHERDMAISEGSIKDLDLATGRFSGAACLCPSALASRWTRRCSSRPGGRIILSRASTAGSRVTRKPPFPSGRGTPA